MNITGVLAVVGLAANAFAGALECRVNGEWHDIASPACQAPASSKEVDDGDQSMRALAGDPRIQLVRVDPGAHETLVLVQLAASQEESRAARVGTDAVQRLVAGRDERRRASANALGPTERDYEVVVTDASGEFIARGLKLAPADRMGWD